MGFKENLRALRERSGLTQTEMANKAGVPFRSYQNWEAGSREPRIQALAALSFAIGASVDELLQGEGPTASPSRGRPRKPAKPARARKEK